MLIIPQFLSVECIGGYYGPLEGGPPEVDSPQKPRKNQFSIINISPVHDQSFRFDQNFTIRSAASLVTLDLQLYLSLVNRVDP
jgi:hypothetical protein